MAAIASRALEIDGATGRVSPQSVIRARRIDRTWSSSIGLITCCADVSW